jgi:hypothetical protein
MAPVVRNRNASGGTGVFLPASQQAPAPPNDAASLQQAQQAQERMIFDNVETILRDKEAGGQLQL